MSILIFVNKTEIYIFNILILLNIFNNHQTMVMLNKVLFFGKYYFHIILQNGGRVVCHILLKYAIHLFFRQPENDIRVGIIWHIKFWLASGDHAVLRI